MLIDILFIILLLIAVLVGYQHGLVRPLLFEIFFLLALLIIVRDRHAYEAAMQKYLHANALVAALLAIVVALVAGYIGGMIGGMIHRMPVVRGVDGFLGIFVHAAVVILLAYIVLSALITLDRAFAPTLATAGMTNKQVQQLARSLQGNALTAMLIDDQDLKKLQAQATKPGSTAHIETVPQLDQLQTFYEQFLQPQLSGSRAAPIIMRIGQRVPIIGHAGPADLPRAAPAPTPSGSPKASPTR